MSIFFKLELQTNIDISALVCIDISNIVVRISDTLNLVDGYLGKVIGRV